jgi:glycyl-tRNA synthetase alpha subunit
MNTQKSVYNKLFKQEATELASHEVLLAEFADIKTQIDRAEGEYKKILDYTNRISALKQEAKKNTSVDVLNKIYSELSSDRASFITKVKALGIDETKIPQPKQYEDAMKRVSALFNKGKEYALDFQK